MAKSIFEIGATLGTGAAINVELGWIPDYVKLVNATDSGDLVTEAWLQPLIAFTSGGTTTLAAGHVIRGTTSRAEAGVDAVLLTGGTFAAGTAAGWIVPSWIVGTFVAETVVIQNLSTGVIGTDDATVAVASTYSLASAGATQATTAGVDTSIIPYAGSTTASQGFTIGLTVSENLKLLRWIAMRSAS